MRTALAMVVGAVLAVGCGGNEQSPPPDLAGMWSSTDGVLACSGQTPEISVGEDHVSMVCEWQCATINGRDFEEVLIGFVQDGAEWRVESRFWVDGACH